MLLNQRYTQAYNTIIEAFFLLKRSYTLTSSVDKRKQIDKCLDSLYVATNILNSKVIGKNEKQKKEEYYPLFDFDLN